MKYFTPGALKPSEKTLRLIKEIARSYRVVKMENGSYVAFCLN